MARAALAVLRLRQSVFLVALALGLCVACTRAPRGPLAGSSDAWNKTSEPERAPPVAAPSWDAYAVVRAWPAANAAPFTSRGHQPEQLVDVRVSPEALSTYAGLVTDSVFPEGTVLAELSHPSGGRGFAMQKVAAKWSFFELDPLGGVLASGALPLCAGCHHQALADGVFGLPRTEPAPR